MSQIVSHTVSITEGISPVVIELHPTSLKTENGSRDRTDGLPHIVPIDLRDAVKHFRSDRQVLAELRAVGAEATAVLECDEGTDDGHDGFLSAGSGTVISDDTASVRGGTDSSADVSDVPPGPAPDSLGAGPGGLGPEGGRAMSARDHYEELFNKPAPQSHKERFDAYIRATKPDQDALNTIMAAFRVIDALEHLPWTANPQLLQLAVDVLQRLHQLLNGVTQQLVGLVDGRVSKEPTGAVNLLADARHDDSPSTQAAAGNADNISVEGDHGSPVAGAPALAPDSPGQGWASPAASATRKPGRR